MDMPAIGEDSPRGIRCQIDWSYAGLPQRLERGGPIGGGDHDLEARISSRDMRSAPMSPPPCSTRCAPPTARARRI